jgi:flagellar hook-basal body complex protein FliE
MIKSIGEFKNVLDTSNDIKWLDRKNIKNDNVKIENESSQKSFNDFFVNSLMKVNELQTEANVAVEKLATGQSQNLHETLLIVEQAEMAFKTMNQIRMKLIDAYKEVMRMQI